MSDVGEDGGVDREVKYRCDGKIAHKNGVWPEAIAYKDPDGITMGFNVDGEPFRGIRVSSEVVVFGTSSDWNLTVTIDHDQMIIYDDSGDLPDMVQFEVGKWEAGKVDIDVAGFQVDVRMVRGKEELPAEVSGE